MMWFTQPLLPWDLLLAHSICLVVALWLDSQFGEPSRWHPLVGFGSLVKWIEKRSRRLNFLTALSQGRLAWCLAVLPCVGGCALVSMALEAASLWVWAGFNTIALYLTLGGRSLVEHSQNIFIPLRSGDIEQARLQVSMIVSRNTDKMSEADMSSAAIESVLENGNDAVFGPMFWFLLFGAPGALLFRLANTLDAMWGYKTEQYLYFGRLSAKLDDALGWLPARITALTYALQGNIRGGLTCWWTQAKSCASPNGGVVMTCGAGALGITIGGPTYYHGKLHHKPPMGRGPKATWQAIPRANRLVTRGSFGLAYLLLVCVGLGVFTWP